MREFISYTEARECLLNIVSPVEKETVPLFDSIGRVLGQKVIASADVPPFDRSPYDGYAFQSEDTKDASKECPVTLTILEEIAAGAVPKYPVTKGYASKILTGAPIPKGADAVIMFEKTEFTEEKVKIFHPEKSGSNIIRAGEDVKKGTILADSGNKIDPALIGVLAGQNIANPLVYKIPKIGIISTGSELLEIGDEPEEGKIYNSNQFVLSAVLEKIGCAPVILGSVKDNIEEICEKILEGIASCDAILLTGGVSVGDYDLTPAAMEMAGVNCLFRGVELKPGMACAYGEQDGKIICGLSGNPASSWINFYMVAYPAIRKLCGYQLCVPQEFTVKLMDDFPKKSVKTRILRGTLEFRDGTVCMKVPEGQGNVQLSSALGCNVMAIIPAGSGPIPANTELKGFMI